MHLLCRLFILVLALALAGCPGTLTFISGDVGQLGDDDDSLGDDDDSVGDDDDSVGDDDDSVGDDDDSLGDDDDSVGDDDDSVGDDDDVEPDHVDCGPWVVPSTGNDEVRVFSGDAFLELTNSGWVWVGCEVERYFDSSGNLDCENYWLVGGQMTQWDGGATAAEYYLEFTIQGGPTACGDGENEDWRYLVDYDFPASTLDLSWANADGGGWSLWSEAPFVMNGNQTEVEFEYITEVMGAR